MPWLAFQFSFEVFGYDLQFMFTTQYWLWAKIHDADSGLYSYDLGLLSITIIDIEKQNAWLKENIDKFPSLEEVEEKLINKL